MRQAGTCPDEPRTRPAEAAGRQSALVAEILELRAENEQLTRALSSRAVIDRACGMIMALAPCSGERAWELLVTVSQHCNVKVRDVAAALVATARDEPLPERMRAELRRAMRDLRDRR